MCVVFSIFYHSFTLYISSTKHIHKTEVFAPFKVHNNSQKCLCVVRNKKNLLRKWQNGKEIHTHTHIRRRTKKKNTYTTFDEYIENISGKMREIHVILLHHSNPLESIFIRFDEK